MNHDDMRFLVMAALIPAACIVGLVLGALLSAGLLLAVGVL